MSWGILMPKYHPVCVFSTSGGYHEYIGDVQYIGGMSSTSGGYHDACGGYHEYIGGCSVPWGFQ